MGDSNTTAHVNEVFYSVQGEGMRAGTANVFVRLSGCNMQCRMESGPKSPGGFDCDTEFMSGKAWTWAAMHIEACRLADVPDDFVFRGNSGDAKRWIIFTGGEPGLQLTTAMCNFFRGRGWKLAVETNGSVLLPLRDVEDLVAEYGESFRDAIEAALAALRGGGEAVGLVSHNVLWSFENVLGMFALDWITVSPKVAEHAIKQRWANELKYVRSGNQELPRSVVYAEHRLLSPAFNGLVVDAEAVANCVRLVKSDPNWRLSVQLHKSWKVL